MSKKIKKTQMDFLLNPTAKERKDNEKKRPPKGRNVPEPENASEAGEERPGWYSEADIDAAQNAKKVKRFPKPFKHKEKIPEITPLQSGSVDILDIITPSSADLYHRDYIMVDGMFMAYLYLTGYGYSTTVGNGWLNPLVEAGEGINLIFTINKQPKDKTLSKISQATMINRSRMRDVGDTRSDYEELDSAISAGMYLKDGMNRYNEDLYYMHTMIEVSS